VPDAAAGAHLVEGLVDARERVAGGDQRLEVELAGAPQRDEARDVAQRVAAAEDAADELLLLHAEERGG
jgi:hypothetical protein